MAAPKPQIMRDGTGYVRFCRTDRIDNVKPAR